MFINKIKTILACFILLGFLAGTVNSAGAQSSATAELPQTAAQISALTAQASDLVTFSQLVTNDIFLNGPFDASSIYFSLPANWKVTSGAQLNLSMTATFNQNAQASSGTFQGSAGTITVTLNNALVGVVPIDTAGDVNIQLPIPPQALAVPRTDGLYQLRFLLESGWTCQFDENMLVVLHAASSMTLPHETIKPDTSLINFPFPIYQGDAIFTLPVLVVIPDKASAAELQSAMTIAAGFGNLSSSKLAMDLTTVSQLTSEQMAGNNLILVGNAATLPVLDKLTLPLPTSSGAFANPGGNPDDGMIQLVNSPWSEDKVVLVVSGNTEAATIKAAQAVSAGSVRSNAQPNVAIVDAVKSALIPNSQRVDQSLADMGYAGKELKDVGVNYAGYKFFVPPGQTITKDAYFELQYGHSSLLQFDRAGIVVSVNGQPIGSVSLKEETARQAVNQVRFSIPPAVVLTGSNSLEVKVNMVPFDRCSNPDLNGVYTNIWPESNFHLPMMQAVTSPTANYDLSSYPAPFAYDSALNTTAFILQRDNLASWRDAFRIASYLGDRSNGTVTMLSTFFADELPEAERSKYNFIMVGQPSQLPILSEINKLLPAPFDFGQNVALEPEMQVKYRINPKATVGYVEMLASPWNADHIILAAVGNEPQGVTWAASHLVEPLSWALAGNFAVINDLKVYTANTRQTTITPGISAAQSPLLEVVPPVVEIGIPAPYRPVWILPALAVSVALILLTIIAAIFINWSGKRSGSKPTVLDKN